jgi:hypothetical protein
MRPPETPTKQVRLTSIKETKPEGLSQVPDDKTENERLALELESQRIQNVGLKQDIEERKRYANRNFWLIVCWLAVINVLLFIQGFRATLLGHTFELPASVLLTTVGSTAASVLGIFLIVTNYLFPKR